MLCSIICPNKVQPSA